MRPSPDAATIGVDSKVTVENLATFLEPQGGQKVKIGPQGPCKVALSIISGDQKRTKFARYFSGLRQNFWRRRTIGGHTVNRLVAGSNPARGATSERKCELRAP